MALYHLSLKVNKHNTKTVKGKDHADYINREGKFKDVDEKNILKTQTFTSKNEIKLITTENLSGKVNKLYINSSGSIIQKGDSLKITDNASEETVQLALALAKRISVTDKIDISGSDDFKDKVSKSIVEMNYVDNVNIVNDEVNNKIKNIQKEYEADGKRISEYHQKCKDRHGVSLANVEFSEENSVCEFNTKNEFSLQDVSIWDMDVQQSGLGMFLSNSSSNGMELEETDKYQPMRRDVLRREKRNVEVLADKLLSANKKEAIAASHADYINRENIFAKKGGCVYKSNHLPKWANNSPKVFFAAADKYEQKNGTPYRELELSLQQELTLEQNIEIINIFIKQCEVLQDKYFAFAIHDKEAALDNTKQQIHCHLMFSERCIDEYEKVNERPPEVFFSRARNKNPELGGCRKDRRFSMDNIKIRRETLANIRKLWADINNQILKKYGVDKEISHKSLSEQREDALKNKDFVKAEILNRAPEQYLGANICIDKSNSKVINLLERRKEIQERNKLIKASYLFEDIKRQDELLVNADLAKKQGAKVLSDVLTRKDVNTSKANSISVLREQFIDLSNKLADKSKDVITYRVALERSRTKHMTSEEYHAYMNLKIISNDEFKLKRELNILQRDNSNINRQNEITSLLNKYQNVKNEFKNILKVANKRLLKPEYKAKITKEVNIILRENEPVKREYELLTNKLTLVTNKLRAYILNNLSQEQNNTVNSSNRYTALQVDNILKNLSQELSININKLQKDLEKLYSKVISEERAKIMATDIVTKGKYKTFRELITKINKDKEKLKDIVENIDVLKNKLQDTKFKLVYDKNINIKYSLEKSIIENERYAMNLKQDIVNYLNKPEVKMYISKIVNGILEKNLPIKNNYNQLNNNLNNMRLQLHTIGKLRKAAGMQIQLDKGKNIAYEVKETGYSSNNYNNNTNNAKILAEAFASNSSMGNLVARIVDDEYDEFKDNITINNADRLVQETDNALSL